MRTIGSFIKAQILVFGGAAIGRIIQKVLVDIAVSIADKWPSFGSLGG